MKNWYIELFSFHFSVLGSSDTVVTTEPNHNMVSSNYDAADASQICSKLHEVAILNRLVEVYEKIDCELSPGIHGVRYEQIVLVICLY